MKNILLALLLANVLYFMWGLLGGDEMPPGVALLDEAKLGPSLDIVSADSAVAGSASAYDAVVGPLCITIGPFKDDADADSATLEYSNEGMKTSRRETRGEVFVGHWVQIRNVADDAAANNLLKTLSDGGMSDAYLVRTEDEGLKISLGLFGDIERAENVEAQARSLGLLAETVERFRDGEIFFVDVGLPPGKGVGSMIEKFGTDRVLMRDTATCPR